MKFCLQLNFEIEKFESVKIYPILLYKFSLHYQIKEKGVTRYFAKKIWSLRKLWI